MKVVYVTNSAKVGGVENHVYYLASGMIKRGHEVYVICPWGEMAQKYFNLGVHIRIDYPALDIDPFYIYRLSKFLRLNQIEILHAHQLKTVVNSLLAAKLAKVPGKIAHVHSPITGWPIPWYKKFINLLINYLAQNCLADVSLALTDRTKKERIQGERIRKEKIMVIPNGIDVEKFKVQSSKFKITVPIDSIVLGTLSRLTEEKGVEVFIRAIAEIPKDKLKNLYFVIAGEGPLKGSLENLAKKLKVEKAIKFTGFVPEQEKVAFYQSLDVFVFPSLHEGFGYVLAEAMAAEVVTISSDLPVLRELTREGAFGYHFKMGDSHDLARVILKVLARLDEANKLAQEAAIWVKKNYSLDKFISKYEGLYLELLNKR